MSAEAVTIIVSNVVSIAALAGFLWKWVGAVEDKVDDGFRDVNERLDTQNGRIGQLESWRNKVDAYKRGFKAGLKEQD